MLEALQCCKRFEAKMASVWQTTFSKYIFCKRTFYQNLTDICFYRSEGKNRNPIKENNIVWCKIIVNFDISNTQSNISLPSETTIVSASIYDPILAKIFENLDWIKIFDNFDFRQNFRKISILVNIFEKNLDFGHFIFRKSRFWSEFSKMLI